MNKNSVAVIQMVQVVQCIKAHQQHQAKMSADAVVITCEIKH